MIHKLVNVLQSHDWPCGVLFTIGLILTMSDGRFFPWGNIVGLGIIGFVAWAEG